MPRMIVIEANAYEAPAPRKCIWLMLLFSSLLVLRVQQDRYAEAVRWHGGVPDNGPPFPWEKAPLVGKNESFEATFLAPAVRRASTFVQPSQMDAAMMVTGLDRATAMGTDGAPSDVAAVVTGSLRLPPGACPQGSATSGRGGAPCTVGVHEVTASASLIASAASSAVKCHRFVAGPSLGAMRPLEMPSKNGDNGSGVVCLKGLIQAAVPSADKSRAILAWDPPHAAEGLHGSGDSLRGSATCLASVDFPGMQVGKVVEVHSASTVLYDAASRSVLTVGFSGAQTLVIRMYDSITLNPTHKFRLPLSVAWLLHGSKQSDGYLLFLGSEQPFVGTLFVLDLVNGDIFEQDPPSAATHKRKGRRVLPRAMFVERLITSATAGNNTSLSSGARCSAMMQPL